MSDPSHPSCAAIIVAAGSSQRMGFDKLAATLNGKPVLRHTVEAFLAADSITSIVLVCPDDRWKLLDGMDFTKPITRVDGGTHRQDSVVNGLNAVIPGTRYVAVHDGARPLVSPDDINACVAAAYQHGAATLARRVTETMKRSDADNFSADAVDRNDLWSMETPQTFDLECLKNAYQYVARKSLHVTDEVSAIEANGGRVKFIESQHPNLKITTPADLIVAEATMKIVD